MSALLLDSRLSLVYDLYDSCDLAADIGTDHAHLPAALLQRGRCRRMILTDISPDALANARRVITRLSLSDRVSFRLGDGLSPLSEPCAVISVTGMGGRTIREILLSGREKLSGASLLLSAHTDLPLVRQTVADLGYHLDREEPCFAAGRYYLVFRARPGAAPLSDQQLRTGSPLLFRSASPVLRPYLRRRADILESRLKGLLSAAVPDESLIRETREDLALYRNYL